MAKEKKSLIYRHFKDNKIAYFLVFAAFFIGIISGAICVKNLSLEQGSEIHTFLKEVFLGIKTQKLSAEVVFKNAIFNNLKWIVLVWFMGISIYTTPVILGIIGYKGFSLGFTLAYFLRQFKWSGFWFSFCAIFPQSFLYIPSLAFLGIIAIGHAVRRFALRNKAEDKKELMRYFGIWLIIMLILGSAAAALEMLISGMGLQNALYSLIEF